MLGKLIPSQDNILRFAWPRWRYLTVSYSFDIMLTKWGLARWSHILCRSFIYGARTINVVYPHLKVSIRSVCSASWNVVFERVSKNNKQFFTVRVQTPRPKTVRRVRGSRPKNVTSVQGVPTRNCKKSPGVRTVLFTVFSMGSRPFYWRKWGTDLKTERRVRGSRLKTVRRGRGSRPKL